MLSFDNLFRNINTFNLFILSCYVYDKSLGRTSDSFPHSMKKSQKFICFTVFLRVQLLVRSANCWRICSGKCCPGVYCTLCGIIYDVVDY